MLFPFPSQCWDSTDLPTQSLWHCYGRGRLGALEGNVPEENSHKIHLCGKKRADILSNLAVSVAYYKQPSQNVVDLNNSHIIFLRVLWTGLTWGHAHSHSQWGAAGLGGPQWPDSHVWLLVMAVGKSPASPTVILLPVGQAGFISQGSQGCTLRGWSCNVP